MSSLIEVTQETSTITPRQKFEGHTAWVAGAIHLPCGRQMITCSSDGSLRVWDLKSGKQIGEWQDGEGGVLTIALSPDGKKMVSGGEDGAVRLWDVDTGKVIAKWIGHTDMVWSVCWSRDGRRVLSGSFDGTARQWDVENGETILAPIKTGHGWVIAVVYSPDMTMFATGGRDPDNSTEYPVKIWDAKTGELVATLKGHTNEVRCLAWTLDGKTLVSGSADDSIRTWNTTTWTQMVLLEGHTNLIWGIAISPNSRIIASASYDTTGRLWSLENSQPISLPLHHAGPVYCMSFSADGKLLATGCRDNNAYTWDVSSILREAGQLDKWLLAGNPTRRPVRPFDLFADATRRPVRQPIKVPQRRVPQGFFDDPPPDRAHVSVRHHLDPRSWVSHVSTLRGYFSSLFRPIHPGAYDTPSRPRPFHWVRNRLSGRTNGEDIELHEHHTEAVDVPYAKGKRRNASAREKRRPIPKKAAASSSRPPNTNVAQQSSSVAQAQSSSQPHAAASTTALPVITNTTSSTDLHVTIPHAGRWTRFWLPICCPSSEYTDGHH